MCDEKSDIKRHIEIIASAVAEIENGIAVAEKNLKALFNNGHIKNDRQRDAAIKGLQEMDLLRTAPKPDAEQLRNDFTEGS